VLRRLTRLLIGLAAALSLAGCFSAPAQIISLDPNRGSTNIAADTPIKVIFDRQVRHESVAAHFSVSPAIPGCDLRSAFSAAPGAPCTIQWLNDQPGFALVHNGAIFAPDTKYTFDLAPGVADDSGTINSLDHQWDVSTDVAPIVVATSPSEGATIPRDAPLSVNFSRPMDETTAAAAVRLVPPVPGTRVVRNGRDHGRFLVEAGSLLRPDIVYSLEIGTGATDEHGQPLAAPVAVHFRTGPIAPGGHALVLANHAGEGATDVVLSQLQPVQFGEPIPAETILAATRCATPGGCGLVPNGGPLVTFRDARLAPGSRWLAVVESDQTVAAAPVRLRVIDLADESDRLVVPGAALPAWSSSGSTLAYADGSGAVHLFLPATKAFQPLPPGPPLADRPVWLGNGDTLALPVQPSTGRPASIDLAVPGLGARSALPGLAGALSHPVAAPASGALAVTQTSGADTSVWVEGNGAAPAKLPATRGIGFLDAGRLLCAAADPSDLVVVDLATRDRVPLPQQPPTDAAGSLVVAPSGRQLAYVSVDPQGIAQAVVANADGTGAQPLTQFGPGISAVSVVFE
jgi:hypothetical protein